MGLINFGEVDQDLVEGIPVQVGMQAQISLFRIKGNSESSTWTCVYCVVVKGEVPTENLKHLVDRCKKI